MLGIAAQSFVQTIQEPTISFDLKKVQKVYDNYVVNWHPGLSLIIGHPFKNSEFCKQIKQEQDAIKDVFTSFNMDDVLILYDVDSQVHATLIELASQHNKDRVDQQFLSEDELVFSNEEKVSTRKINYAARWIKKAQPFDIELGPDVLSAEHCEQTLRIIDSGQIVMKGRAKDRKLLAEIRTEFEKEAGIIHKYGSQDDEFFFVIGYLKSDPRLNDRQFRAELERCINARRPNIQLALKVDSVKVMMYQKYSLDADACVWESRECRLGEELDLPQQTLLDSVIGIIKEKKLLIQQQEREAI